MDALDNVLKIEEKLVTKATLANIPLGGTFELLPLCNMNCDMCFIRLDKSKMDRIGQLKSADEWLRVAEQMRKAGTLFVLLTGGEPFLYPEFIKLYKGLKKLGMIITINTNGTLVTEEIAQCLGEDKPRRVNITLYGASNETYAKLCHNPIGYDQTIKGIELLLKQKIDIKLNGSIVPENRHEINQLQDIADKYNLYMKMDTYMYPTSRERLRPFRQDARLTATEAARASVEIKERQESKESFDSYKQYMMSRCEQEHMDKGNEINCRAGKSAFWITWYGDMTPCIFMKKPGINVFNEGFDASWKYIVDKTKEVHLPTACATCKNREVCQVCAASAYCETNSYDEKPTYMCHYVESIINEIRSKK